jgi:NADPH:quinone reductase-like Zn-dependent oxidoreductase
MAATAMKAIINDKYGSPDDLQFQEIEKPVIGDDSVLVRVRAASVNPADWRPLKGKPYLIRPVIGLRRPKSRVPGTDVAGIVEAVGKDVTEFRPGDEVFGARTGAFAEYVCGLERNFVPKPEGITFEQAAAIPIAGCTALQAVRDHGQLQPGQRVLINGAAGGVGTFAVQLAKAFGGHVTGVCSTRNVEMVRSIGADQVIDYSEEDFSRSGQRYDLIVDDVGNRSLRALRRVLSPKGTLVIVGAKDSNWLLALLALPLKARLVSPFVGQRMISFIAQIRKEDLPLLKELIEAGKVTPVIDRTYPLSETAEAYRYVQSLHARAKVVVTV